MVPNVVDIGHYLLTQLLSHLLIFSLEELKHIFIGEGAVEFDGVAHSAADNEDTSCQTGCPDEENEVLVYKTSDIWVGEEL